MRTRTRATTKRQKKRTRATATTTTNTILTSGSSFPPPLPQLATLSLPSPIFSSHSVLDLLAPLRFDSPVSSSGRSTSTRVRSGSAISHTSTFSERRSREPTLTFSRPREVKDSRIRKKGRDEDPWVAVFPEAELELPGGEETLNWSEKLWNELREFLETRGYRVEETEPKEVSL